MIPAPSSERQAGASVRATPPRGRLAVMRPVAAASQRPIRVLQITDSLNPGGLERVAVNVGNLLPRNRVTSYFCTTRMDGSLAAAIDPDIPRLRLERRWRFDRRGLQRLVQFVRDHQIDVLHAHGTSLFIAAAAAARLEPRRAIVWHDHLGAYATRATWLYRLAARRVQGVITVNEPMADWCRSALKVPADRVWYIPNFVSPDRQEAPLSLDLPGSPGARIVCTAHLRPAKGHLTLLRALALARVHVPNVHLLLAGGVADTAHFQALEEEVQRLDLAAHVTFLGTRSDIGAILRQADVGVLSSESEGFPMALIEYGLAGLPSVATSVGQCPDVLDSGRAGILVPPGHVERLADALVRLLTSPAHRRLGEAFRERVQTLYSAERVIGQICAVYDTVLGHARC